MAKGYNLTVQLNLQGPNNLSGVVNNINKRLNNIQANVNVKLPTSTLRQIAQVNRNLKQTGKDAANAASGMEKFGKAAGLAVKRFGAFTAATAGFYAITRATQQSLEKFVEFDRQVTRIAQVTNSTKQSLNGLTNEITKLSVSLGASSSELASVAVTLSQAGLSARETQRALKALALTTLAPTFSNLNNTVEGSIALMKQFSISTRQLEQALGSINAVAGSFAVEAGDLITAVQRAGGVFASASKGVATGTEALNQFLAVFTSVRATTRESAETIATGLRTIFTRIQRADTIEALKAFGVTLTDLEGKFIGPFRAIEQLSKGLRTLDPRSLQFSSIVEELGGFRQVGKVIPLIQRFSTAQQALNVAQQGSGSLARDAATGQQSLGVQISKVQQQFDALIRSIGQTGEFRQFITLSLDLASALIKVADAIKPVLPALAALGAAKVVGGLGGLAKGFKGGLGFNQGGMVPGSGNFDSVKANLTPGEFVIRKKAVQAIGADNLYRMNKYAEGGVVKYPSSRRFVKNRKSTYNKDPGVSIQSALGASVPLVLNPKDKVQASIFRRSLSGQDLANKNSKLSSSKAYLNAPSPQARGIAFENLLLQTKNIKRKAGGSSRIDAQSPTGNFVEIKSVQEPVTDADLMKKVAGSIFRPRSNIDDLAMQRASGSSLTNRADVMSIGSLLVFEDSSALSATGKRRSKVGNKKVSQQLRKAAGGSISGQDTVPALLTPGEFVINQGAARRIGSSNLKALNNADKITGYNNGGFVQRFRGGGMPSDPAWKKRGFKIDGGGGGREAGALDLFVIQGGVSAFSAAIGDATTETARAGNVLQSLGTAASASIVAFQALKTFGGKGVSGKVAGRAALGLGAIVAFDGIIKSIANTAADFDKKLGQTNFDKALDTASKSLELLAKNGNDAAAAAQLQAQLASAVNSARAIDAASTSGRGSLREAFMGLVPSLLEYIPSSIMDFRGASSGTGLGTEYDNAASRVRANQGLTGAVSELLDPEGFATQVRAEIAATQDASARRYSAISDMSMQRGLQRVDGGASIAQVAGGLNAEEREAIARSTVAGAKRLDAAGGAGTAAGQDIINKEVTKQLKLTLGPALADRIARNANAAAAQLQVALERTFNKMDQAFSRVAANMDSNFSRAASTLSAGLGKTGIRFDNNQQKSILDNPEAYASNTVKEAIDRVTSNFGPRGSRVGDLAFASTQIGDNIEGIINKRISGAKPGAESETILKGVGADLTNMISGLNLGSDVSATINKQLKEAFKTASKNVAELSGAERDAALKEEINNIVKNLPSLNGALDVVKRGFEVLGSAQKQYSQAVQQISEAIIQRNEYFNRASSIRREGGLALRKGLGENIPITDVIKNVAASVADQTGGVTGIQQLGDNLKNLIARREQIEARRDSLSGTNSPEWKKLTDQLGSINVEIDKTRSGLETFANSTEIATAALDEISRIRQRAEEQSAFGERLVGSNPQELADIQGLIYTLENVASGGSLDLNNSFMAQRAYMESLMGGGNIFEARQAAQQGLANERGGVVSILKELKPFFGEDNKEFNQMYETVMRSFLSSIGPLTPAFEKMFQARRNATDRQQKLMQVYQRATEAQVQANQALGQAIPIQQAIVASNQNLAAAMANLATAINGMAKRQGFASGGVVYASQGQLVNMQPKGTDTVPAMLTPGEFVVNAKSTKKNLGLLQSINAGGTGTHTDGGVLYAPGGGGVGPIAGVQGRPQQTVTPEQLYQYYRNQNMQKYGTFMPRYNLATGRYEMKGTMPLAYQHLAYSQAEAHFNQLNAQEQQVAIQKQQQKYMTGLQNSYIAERKAALKKRFPGASDAQINTFVQNEAQDPAKLYAHQQKKKQEHYAYVQAYKAAQFAGQEVPDKMLSQQEYVKQENPPTVSSILGKRAGTKTAGGGFMFGGMNVKSGRPGALFSGSTRDSDGAQKRHDEKYLYKHRDAATGQLKFTRGNIVGTDSSGNLQIATVDRDGNLTGDTATVSYDNLTPGGKTKAAGQLTTSLVDGTGSAVVAGAGAASDFISGVINTAEGVGSSIISAYEQQKLERKKRRERREALFAQGEQIGSNIVGAVKDTVSTATNVVGEASNLVTKGIESLAYYSLPATNVIGKRYGNDYDPAQIAAINRMQNRPAGAAGNTARVETFKNTHPGLNASEYTNFIEDVRVAESATKADLEKFGSDSITSNFSKGYSITRYKDGRVEVNVPTAQQVEQATTGYSTNVRTGLFKDYNDTNPDLVNPLVPTLNMPGRVGSTFMDDSLIERAGHFITAVGPFAGAPGPAGLGQRPLHVTKPVTVTPIPRPRIFRGTTPGLLSNLPKKTAKDTPLSYGPGTSSPLPRSRFGPASVARQKVLARGPAAQKMYNQLRDNGMPHDQAIMTMQGQGFNPKSRATEGKLMENYGFEGLKTPTAQKPRVKLPVSQSGRSGQSGQSGQSGASSSVDFTNVRGGRPQGTQTSESAAMRQARLVGDPRGTAGSGYGRRQTLTASPMSRSGSASESAARELFLKYGIGSLPGGSTSVGAKPTTTTPAAKATTPAAKATTTTPAAKATTTTPAAKPAPTGKTLFQKIFRPKQTDVKPKTRPQMKSFAEERMENFEKINKDPSFTLSAVRKRYGNSQNKSEREFVDQYEKMPRVLDAFRTYGAGQYGRGFFSSKRPEEQSFGKGFRQFADKQMLQAGAPRTESGAYAGMGYRIDSGIARVYGPDAAGRRGAVLYEIPMGKVKKPANLEKLFKAQGIQRFASGGMVGSYGNVSFEKQTDSRGKEFGGALRSVNDYFSAGGFAKGTDTVPAMLTPGEFVINRDATKRNRGLLESINGSGKPMSRGGVVYADNGGAVGNGGGSGGGGIDFAGFITATNTLNPNLATFAEAATALSERDFGVLNDAGTKFEGASNAFDRAAKNFGSPLTKFDNSIGTFVDKTNQLIAAISNMGQIQGTVNVVGTISFAPIEVNVLGLDQIAGLIGGIENSILAQVGTALSQDNPGITVNTLSSGGSQIA